MNYDIELDVRIDVQEAFDNLPSTRAQQSFLMENINLLDDGFLVDELKSRGYSVSDEWLDKACEWIGTALYLDYERSIEHRYASLEELLNDFKKAMLDG